VRADKLTLAAMEATLWGVARGEPNPTRAMLDAGTAELRARAESFASRFPGARVADGASVTGGGSLPGRTLPSSVVVFESPHPQNVAARLRRADPPVVARVERGALVVDLRTVPLADEPALEAALHTAVDAFTVRIAHQEDARAIAEMQIDSMRAAYRGIVADSLLDSYRVTEFEAWRRRAIAERRAAGGETFVAVRDGSLLAFSTCGPCRDDDAAGAGELYGLYAAPEAWGRGVGRALIAATEQHLARAHDVVVIWTFELNDRARRAYERAGYTLDGARRANASFGGAIEVRYRKALR
jgi:RimJ/RimL family protein N-acetyltransferase